MGGEAPVLKPKRATLMAPEFRLQWVGFRRANMSDERDPHDFPGGDSIGSRLRTRGPYHLSVLNHAAMAPFVVRIEHPVGNFEAWKKAFDSDPVGRRTSGVRRYRILRPGDDPKFVMIDLEFDQAAEAENFRTAMLKLWDGVEAQRVLRDPRMRIVEIVESRDY